MVLKIWWLAFGIFWLSLPTLVWSRYSFIFRVAPVAYVTSQARGRIGAVAAGLHHSHSKAGSEQHLWLTLQLTATPDPLTNWASSGIKPAPSWMLVGFITTEPRQEIPFALKFDVYLIDIHLSLAAIELFSLTHSNFFTMFSALNRLGIFLVV